MVTSRGIDDALRATSNIHEASHLSSDHKIWTLGWHYMREMQQQCGIKDMLANILTQTEISGVIKFSSVIASSQDLYAQY